MDVFVSYSRQDSEVISPLVALLRCAGVDVFMDVRSIAFGEDWKAAINRAIT
ncbi:MAG: toll/interleukin-1 receptor domain-containing protein, partial [Gammaproteobacteria bacterium]|nr:toll/interleukin-1 receptor domain-containing protein [Gammaproteobacteria bacterium]